MDHQRRKSQVQMESSGGLEVPGKGLIIPPGTGELLHYIVSSLSSLYSIHKMNTESIAKKLLSSTRKLITAEYFEFFYCEKDRLYPLNKKYPVQYFEINNKSLIGFVSQNKLFQIFNNPHTSTLYSSFSEKTLPYSWQDNRLIIPSSVCAVPISFPVTGDLFGVLMMYNKLDSRQLKNCFWVNDVHIAQSIGLILTGHLKMHMEIHCQPPDNSFPSEAALQKDQSRYKSIQKWCKQVSVVTNSTENKHFIARDLLQKMYAEASPEILIKATMQIICNLTNSEEASLAWKLKEDFVMFTETSFMETCEIDKLGVLQAALESARALIYQKSEGYTLVLPMNRNEESMVFLIDNKRDETLTQFERYTKEDESVVIDIGKALFSVVSNFVNNRPVISTQLRNKLRHYLTDLNSHPIISTIRTASQQLLNCDRGTVFIRENDQMVVKAQGKELEMPVGFSVPVGKGIVGYVAQTGISQNIEDVYTDSRFNSEVDRLTGYTTRSMLCMPVFNNKNEVIAALQMINKSGGPFDELDEETLDLFSEMVSSVLINCDMFHKAMEERTRLLNILNSIATYVLVLNEEGKLDYTNKSLEGIFGIKTEYAQQNPYSVWLKKDRQLVLDIASVYQKPTEKVHRDGEKIKPVTGYPRDEVFKVLNYSIIALQEVSGENAGVIIILEDSTEMEELSSKYKAMQHQLLSLTSPIQALTSLQKCIAKLEEISGEIREPTLKEELVQIVRILKRGNLHKPEIQLSSEVSFGKSALIEYNGEESPSSVMVSKTNRKFSFEELIELEGLSEDLLNVDLNFSDVVDPFAYLTSMLNKFELISTFSINPSKLQLFFSAVRANYSPKPNPYHNFYHGMTVLHSTFLMLTTSPAGSFFSSQQILALLLAALCHDIGHTGHNNLFEVNIQSSLAVIYNDISVLENHHAALTFKLLQFDKHNILENLPKDMFKSVKKLMVECILGTDMSKHFRMLADMAARFNDIPETPLGELEGDHSNAATFLVHCADLAHPTKGFAEYSKWSSLICKEFSLQVVDEISIGIPPTEFMIGLDDPLRFYKNEVGFLTVIIKPLWESLNIWLNPHIDHLMENLDNNLKKYQELLSEYT